MKGQATQLAVVGALLGLLACGRASEAEPKNDDPKPVKRDASVIAERDGGRDSGTPLNPTRGDAGPDAGHPILPRLGLNALRPQVELDAGHPFGESDALLAELDLLALRVRAVHFSHAVADLDVDDVVARVDRFKKSGASVALQLEIVRRDPITNEPLQVDSAAVLSAAQALFMRGLAADYLFLGSHLDVHLNRLPKERQQEFHNQVSDLLRAVKDDARRPSGLLVGYSTGFEAQQSHPEQFAAWNQASEVIGVDWFAVAPGLRAFDPARAAQTLDALLDAVLKTGLPLVLQQVAYPSRLRGDSLLGSQATFHYDLLEAVSRVGDRVPFAAISSLDDPSAADCARQAADLAAGDEEAFTEAWCSIGVRGAGFMEKPSFSAVVQGFARFSAR